MNVARFFETATRTNGDPFVRLVNGDPFVRRVDDAPDWLVDAVREAHADEMPNDWRYDTCRAIVEMLDDGEDDPSVIADSLVDTYNVDLLDWLRGNLSRSSYVDEFMEMSGDDYVMAGQDIYSMIRGGQYLAIEAMAEILASAYDENVADDDV